MLNFNSKNNKVYNYSGRFAKTKLKLKPKFDEFRTTLGSNSGIKNKLTKAVYGIVMTQILTPQITNYFNSDFTLLFFIKDRFKNFS